MYLKTIELVGFKSFASKMVFKFDQGMTAIVGPNGSGKSNVSDAVRWVLGEQSAKQLRGTKMEDVIFSGTETRKALGYCQVDLTIDNSDRKMPIAYTEVTVSRRVYRSGEGEYFINGTSCRLKDVHELFMDTGVGKEGYSIIGQGQIDKILSTRPDDRRALFDEAAGIVKYKNRKAAAEKSLDMERQNLLRLYDIIGELEKQRDVLEAQAAKARIYLDKKESLKKLELNIFAQETSRLARQISAIEEKETAVSSQVEDAEKEHEASRQRHHVLSKELEELEASLEGTRQLIAEINSGKERKLSAIALVKEQMAHLSSNHIRALDRIKSLTDKYSAAQEELKELAGQLEAHVTEADRDEKALGQGNARLAEIDAALQAAEGGVESLRSDMIEQISSLSGDRSRVNRLEADLEHQTTRRETAGKQAALIEERRLALQDASEGAKGSLEEKKRQLEEQVAMYRSAKTKQEADARELAELEQQAADVRYEQHREESKASAMAAVEEDYEGYQFSIKKVMQLRRQRPGYEGRIHGVVADVARTAKAYEKAIETALGGAYQHVITDNEETAKELISYLKSGKLGRATFLPLSTIRKREPKVPKAMSRKGFIGFADELVETGEQYRGIMSHLLGNIAVADNLENAMTIARSTGFSLRIVTLDGDVVNPGGAMTGGAYKNDRNQFLSRKRLLEEHQARAAKLSALAEEYSRRLDEAKTRRREEAAALEAMAEAIREQKEALHREEMQAGQLSAQLLKAEQDLLELKEELKELDSILEAGRGELRELADRLDGADRSRGEAQQRIEALSSEVLSLKSEKEKLLEELTALRVKASASEQKKRHAEAMKKRMTEEAESIREDVEALKKEITDGKTSYIDKEAEIEAAKAEMARLSDKAALLEGELAAMMTRRQQMHKDREALFEKREEASARIALLEKEIARLENQKVKLEVQKENLLDYMWTEYEMTYIQAQAYVDESMGPLGTAKQAIGKLKSEIKDLGDVNVNAIEDFKQVKERHGFLSEQRDDVVKAEKKLVQVIEDLERSMQEQFREQFKAINREFGFMFRELFGGGKAMLELTDEANLLESGVQIIAQPPGKKLQNMMLLSGGERAFTAIALLFAIQSLKPSPFCVLDEIDAALDDANVDRFAKYLLKLSANTQFIVITHKQGTMAAADALYGITMQEKGVSTQVSVKLIEDELF